MKDRILKLIEKYNIDNLIIKKNGSILLINSHKHKRTERKINRRNIENNNRTIKLITEAKQKCEKDNIKITRKLIVEMTGLSKSTVQQNWIKEISKSDF